MSDSIKVVIKVRPLIKREINEKLPIQWTVQGNSIMPVDPELRKRGDGIFYFDHILDMSQTNNDLFDVVAKPIIDASINGVNGTIFAYGQTGSGKTYSMMGSKENLGVIPLAINYIFETIDNSYCREFLLRVSYIEIYNERVNDLLDTNGTDLKIKEDAKTRLVRVDGCKEVVCNAPNKVLEVMKSGDRNRRTAETNMNDRSSRSHTIFRITIESRESTASDGAAVHVSQLNLVDLAGSERTKSTGAVGERFNEGRHINLSLTSLGLVIKQLSESQENPQRFINFRDSKLTRILQASLGGNAMTAIICAITPAALEETQCSLAFASRAKRIKNKPEVNEVLSDEALLKRYRKQMAKLNADLERLKNTDVEKRESELMERERSNQILLERLELLKKSIVCGNSTSEAESFKTKAKRRRTWGGGRTLSSKSLPDHIVGLPTIKELDKTPEKVKKKQNIKRRQSIFETIDFQNQTFQTAFTDFELELIESETARTKNERFSGSSSTGDEDYVMKLMPSTGNTRNVQFRDDVCFLGEKTPESTECQDAVVQAELSSPGTPKPVLRNRFAFLMEQFDALRVDHSYLEEYAKLEKQMFVDDAVKLAVAEHEKRLAASEEKCREINDRYTKLESHSSAANKRLAELEQQLAESANSFKALKRENQDLIDALNKTKKEKPVIGSQTTNNEKETSSIFANATYFEEMEVSDVQDDSMLVNDMQDSSLAIMTTSKLDETKKLKEISNSAYSEFIKQIGEKSSDELVTVMQELINSKLSLEEDNTNLQLMLQRTAREADDVKNDIRELKSGIEKLQETIHLLTIENTDLTSKLSTEKEHAKETQKSLEEQVNQLNILNTKLSELKITSCTECAHLAELNENRKSLKLEAKALNRKLRELQEKFDQECADSALLRTKANEDLNLSVCDLTMNGSMMLEGNFNISFVEEKVQALHQELESLRDKHDKLSDLYKEKCDEIDKLHDACSRETTPTPTSTDSPRIKRSDEKLDRIQTDMEKLRNDFRVFKKNIAGISAALQKFVSEKAIMQAEIETLRAEKASNLTETPDLKNDDERIAFLENQVAKLEEEIKNSNLIAQQLEKAKISLDAEVESLKAEKMIFEQNILLSSTSSSSSDQERIETLENHVTRLCEEINSSNVLKRQLEDTKASLESQVQSLQAEEAKFSDVSSETGNATTEKIKSLENEVACLREEINKANAYGEEIANAKSSLEAEVESLKAEKASVENKMENTENIAAEEKIKYLENQVALLSEEISKANADKKELMSAKSSLETQVEFLKAEKSLMEEKLKNTDKTQDIATEEKIQFLEIEVAHLSEENRTFNTLKKELMSAKSSLETQVEFLKAEKSSMEEKLKNTDKTQDIATEEKIQFLEIEVARLSEENRTSNTLKKELEGVKSAAESEVEFLKVEKPHEKNTKEAKEISMEEKMQHLKNEVADLKAHNAKLVSEKTVQFSPEIEEEYFAAEKASLEKSIGIDDDSMTRETMKYLENEVSRLSEEINNSNVVKEELVSTKTYLEAEVQSLKAEKVAFDEKVTQTDGTSAQERINLLENEVAHLNDKIIHSNEVKEELESAKSSLEAEVQYLKVEKASNEAETVLTGQEKICGLDRHTVLNLEIETVKSSLEAEIEALKAENIIREESMNDLLKTLQNLESTNSTLKITLEKITSEKDQLVEKIATISQAYDFPNNNDQDFAKIVESLELKLKETDRELDKYMQINQELNNRLTAIKASEANLNSVKSQLEDQIKDLQKERTDNETHLEKLRESLKQLEENNASTIMRLEYVETSLEESQKDNTDLKDKLRLSEKSEEELTNAKLEITNLKAEITSLEKHLIDVQSTVSDLKENNCRLESELEKAEIQKENDSEKEIKEASYETLKEYEKMVEELRTKVQDITHDLHANAKETADMNEQLSKLNSAKNELNEVRSALELEVKSLKLERDDLEATLIDLRKMLNELGEKNSSLDQQLQMLKKEKEKCSEIVTENLENPKLEDYEKTISKMNFRIKEINAELNKFATENEELKLEVAKLKETIEIANIEEQKLAGDGKCSESTELNSDKYFEELESARTCITKEIKSLEPKIKNNEFVDKSINELFALFVRTIMSKEQEIITALNDRFEREKRKLEEQKRQSCDAEKRATIWVKELEAEVEKAQQDLIRQESKTAEFTNEISKLQNLLKESAHENQLLNEKMQVLELDFNTLQTELEKYPGAKHNVSLNSTQEKERLIQEALQTREMELSAKLRLVEKQSKEKLQELTKSLELYKTKNLELSNNLEGLDANERQLKSIADMKSNELIKANNTIENLRRELDVITENYNQLTRQHTEANGQIEEITSVLKTKCDKLSEYKTKLETITPEYEHLKDQAIERQLKLEKYKSEIERMTTENEKQISSLKDCLDSTEIKSASYRKQVADLTNRNTVLQVELTELQTKYEELERTNAKLAKSMRNSTSKIRAAEEMEDLKDQNRTLQRNLDGASNRIADLQEMKTQMLKEIVELQGKYEAIFNENTELKNSLGSFKLCANQATELQTKYESLLQEKNRIALELEDKKATLLQLENKHKDCAKEIEQLKITNKDLDEEMDDIVSKIHELNNDKFELVEKLYVIECSGALGNTNEFKDRIETMQTEIETLKSERDQIRGELDSATKTLEIFKNENSELKIKVGHYDRGDSLSCDSSRSESPALEAVRVDNRRRRSRTELFNQKRQLDILDTNETNCCGQCRCATLQDEVCKLERELVTKNGQIATLEIRIQSENFPHMKRSKDLEELYASSRKRCKLLEAELQKIREMKLLELSSECDKCKHWRSNKRDQSTQCLPPSEKLYLSGMSSGIVEDHIKMTKLQKTNERLKELCRGRHKIVHELQNKIKELEKQLHVSTNEEEKSDPTAVSSLSSTSKSDFASNSRQAMKENVPTIWPIRGPQLNRYANGSPRNIFFE